MIGEQFIKRIKEMLTLAVSLGLVVAAMYITGIGCPIKTFTGISCAGCGMTRAVAAAVRLDFKQAFAYHPLFWTLPMFPFLFLFWEKIPEKIRKGIAGIIIFAYVGVYLIRMIDPRDSIISCNLREGLIAELMSR